jgi:hypothetical protein
MEQEEGGQATEEDEATAPRSRLQETREHSFSEVRFQTQFWFFRSVAKSTASLLLSVLQLEE